MKPVRLLISAVAVAGALGSAPTAHAAPCDDYHDVEVRVGDRCVQADLPDLPPNHG